MEKLKMHSMDIINDNVKKLGELFPECLTEVINDDGKLEKAIDFDKLKSLFSSAAIEGNKERYQFTWPDKSKARALANQPINATLRPCREESVNFDTTENLYIEGDNLDVLKLLRETYYGKVKMIYIDPPYNTGNDFVYKDDFSLNSKTYKNGSGQLDDNGNRMVFNQESNGRFHTAWLNMMYPRLKIARDILSDDGVIFISIDENEVGNLRKIMEEIFGESNFAGEIIWKNSSKNDQAYISIQHEYILCYVKDKAYNLGDWKENKEGVDEIFKAFEGFKKQFGNDWKAIHKAAKEWFKQFPESNPIYSSKHYTWMDERGVYFPDNISGPHFGQYRYDVIHPITGRVCKEPASGWRFSESTMAEKIKRGLIHFGDDETTVPNNKTYLSNTLTQSLTSIKYKDGRVASKKLESLMGGNYFTNPKDVDLLTLLMKAVQIKNGDIVMDFFSGSGTTGEAVMNLGCKESIYSKFILVQLQEDLDLLESKAKGSSKQVLANCISLCDSMNKPHYLSEMGKERLRRAGEKISEEQRSINEDLFSENGFSLDVGFRVLKLDSSNMEDVYYHPEDLRQDELAGLLSNIKEDRTDEDLLFQTMLDLGVVLSSNIEVEVIGGKKVFNVSKGYLFACFDENVDEELITAVAKKVPTYFVIVG